MCMCFVVLLCMGFSEFDVYVMCMLAVLVLTHAGLCMLCGLEKCWFMCLYAGVCAVCALFCRLR